MRENGINRGKNYFGCKEEDFVTQGGKSWKVQQKKSLQTLQEATAPPWLDVTQAWMIRWPTSASCLAHQEGVPHWVELGLVGAGTIHWAAIPPPSLDWRAQAGLADPAPCSPPVFLSMTVWFHPSVQSQLGPLQVVWLLGGYGCVQERANIMRGWYPQKGLLDGWLANNLGTWHLNCSLSVVHCSQTIRTLWFTLNTCFPSESLEGGHMLSRGCLHHQLPV